MAINGSRSKFPDGIDDGFVELFDLPADKVNEARTLAMLKSKAVLSNDEQNQVKNLAISLREYMITPETFNHFQDALYAVEKFFYDEVHGYIEDKQEVWHSYILNFRHVGKWKAGEKYEFQNMVTDEKGDLFLCKREHTSASSNSPLKNANYWQRASAKGEKGDIGLNAIYQGDWSSTKSYKMGDAVAFGRVDWHSPVNYIAKRDNVGKSPDSSPSDWFVYQQLYAGKQLPSGAGAGIHFIQEV